MIQRNRGANKNVERIRDAVVRNPTQSAQKYAL